MPPCTSFDDFDDVPDARSSRSTSAVRSPRVAASSATPDAGDAAADDEHVEVLVGEAAERLGAVEVHSGRLPASTCQMTSPGVPSSRTTGRPDAAQAFMPPIMFDGVEAPLQRAVSVALALRAPERHTHTIRRFIGSLNRAPSSSPSGIHCAPGAWPGLPLVGLAHVEQHVCGRDPLSASTALDLGNAVALEHAHGDSPRSAAISRSSL